MVLFGWWEKVGGDFTDAFFGWRTYSLLVALLQKFPLGENDL